MKNSLLERQINPTEGIAIVCTTAIIVIGVGVAGTLLGSEYESSCVALPGEPPVCTTRFQYKGAGNLDIPMPSLQTVAAALGIGFGIYSGLKNGKLPNQLKDMFDGGDDAELPGSS